MRIHISLIICSLLILATACQGNINEPSPAVDSTNDGVLTQMSPTLATPIDPGLQNLIDKAVADLAQRLSIPISEVKLIEATPVVWPDASLGCPQPGMAYIQVPEDGLLIRLEAGNQIYPYHSGGARDPFLCEVVYQDPGKPPQIDLFNLTPSRPSDTSATPENNIPPGEDQ